MITYDTVEIIADFAKRQNITLPVLADPQSKAIRDFGVLNTAVPQDHLWYGVPYPGTFIVDSGGTVKAKYFEDRYQDRYSAPTILLHEFGSVAGTAETAVKTEHLDMRYYSTADTVHPNERITLVADFLLPPKMHVYTPEVKNYIPIDFKLEASANYSVRPTEYPKGKLMMLPAINEIVPVYEGQFRITQDVVMAAANLLQTAITSGQPLKIRGSLRYQACDDKICYLPKTIPLEFAVKVAPQERDRVPEAIQRKAPTQAP